MGDERAAKVDDLPVGAISRTTGRTISEGEFMLLHNLMGAMTPLHANKHYMESQPFGERILGGGVVLALLSAGWPNSDLYRQLTSEFGVRWTAALNIEGSFKRYIQPGDTLYMEYTIEEVRASASRPGKAIMVVSMRGENQRDEVCCVGTLKAMFDRPDVKSEAG